jgi:hypothetical protein
MQKAFSVPTKGHNYSMSEITQIPLQFSTDMIFLNVYLKSPKTPTNLMFFLKNHFSLNCGYLPCFWESEIIKTTVFIVFLRISIIRNILGNPVKIGGVLGKMPQILLIIPSKVILACQEPVV